jgi:DNA-binding transcriptional LysR family regulator
VELRQLRYVEAVARHRHFTRAADELHVAQSALSQQVRKLEAELGTRLFERTSRSVVVTPAGDAVAARARRMLAEADAIPGDVQELEELVRGHLSVGALLPAGGIDVPELLARFGAEYPGVEVELREGTAADMARHLAAGELDLAFSLLAAQPAAGVIAERLSEEELVAAFPPGRAPATDSVSAKDLAEHVLMCPRSGSALKTAADRLFARAGVPFEVTLESGDPYLLRYLVAEGFGAAILPGSLIERVGPEVEVRKLRPAVKLPVALLRRRDRHPSPAARAFTDFTRRAAKVRPAPGRP